MTTCVLPAAPPSRASWSLRAESAPSDGPSWGRVARGVSGRYRVYGIDRWFDELGFFRLSFPLSGVMVVRMLTNIYAGSLGRAEILPVIMAGYPELPRGSGAVAAARTSLELYLARGLRELGRTCLLIISWVDGGNDLSVENCFFGGEFRTDAIRTRMM